MPAAAPVGYRAERTSLFAMFAFFGMGIGSWLSRIPAVKDALGLSPGQLSVVFAAGTVGMLCALYPASALVGRFGSRAMVRPAAAVLFSGIALLGVAPTRAALAAGMFCVGVGGAALNLAINAQAIGVERLCERPVMPTFHAGYSFGGMAGAALGGLAVAAGVSPGAHLAAVAAGGFAASASVTTGLLATPRAAAPPRLGPVWRSRGLLIVATLAFLSFFSERAAGDWSTVFVKESLGATEAAAAFAYTAFALNMGIGRLLGGRLVLALGRRGVVRAGGLLAAAGLTLPLLAPWPAAGVVGFGVMGLGLASMVPVAMSAAGNLSGIPSEQGIAGVATAGWCASLLGPLALGNLADLSSLRIALGLVVAAGIAMSVLGGRLPVEEPRPAAAAVG